MNRAENFAAKLRALATWYENHPNVPPPTDGTLEFTIYEFNSKPEEIRAIGSGDKTYDGDWFRYIVTRDGFKLTFSDYRQNVCTAVVVGKRMVPTQVIPAVPAIPERVIEAHEEDITEWQCPGSILGRGSSVEMPTTLEIPAPSTPQLAAPLEGEYEDIPA
jgi:hypothetical protein